MKILNIKKRDIDLSSYTKRSAQESDYDELIRENTLVQIDGSPALLYIKLEDDLEPLRACLAGMEFDASTRSGGLRTQSRVFGYQPRVTMRRDFCTATSLAAKEPLKNALICSYGTKVADAYRKVFQEQFDKHADWVNAKVLPEWKIENTPFTSGIVNKNNPLKYHYDAGNIKDVCSCMIALKKNSAGGYLSFPELGIALEIADKSLSIFDGQSLLHGVTPIRRIAENSHRYTVVYYTLQQMWKCEPYEGELTRIKAVKTQREMKRVIRDEKEVIATQHGIEEIDKS